MANIDINSVDVLALSECWLTENSNIPNLPGFNHFHTQSGVGKAGGVMLYYKSHLKISQIFIPELSDNYKEAEFLLVKFTQVNFIMLLTYRHPNCDIKKFIDALDKIMASHCFSSFLTSYVVCGDININLLSTNSHAKEYKNILKGYNFKSLINTPTLSKQFSQSVIDHVWVKNTKLDKTTANICAVQVTDHNMIAINHSHTKNVKYEKTIVRTHNESKILKFITLLSNIDFSLLLESASVMDDKINIFVETIYTLYLTTFPEKKIKRKTKNLPWIDNRIKFLAYRKNQALRKYRKKQTPSNNKRFLTMKNHLNAAIKRNKKIYIQGSLKVASNKQKWLLLNSLVNYKKLNREQFDGPSCDTFGTHYANLFSTIPTSSQPKHNQVINNCLFLFPTNHNEVLTSFQNLPNKRSKQEMDLPLFLWKRIGFIISDPIVYLANFMFETAQFPSLFKKATIIPIFKKGDKNEPANYRPIALLHNLSKIFERLILNRITKFINSFNVLPEFQFGFRANHSTKDAVFALLLKIEENFLANYKTCCIFLDLSKAFDCVNHNTLISILYHLGFRGHACNLIKSYLSNREFTIKYNNACSNCFPILRGVPQGSLLSPILYSLYVSDINKVCEGNIVQYADDSSIIINYVSLPNLQAKLNGISLSLDTYFSSLNLKLNKEKTEIMLFGDNSKTELKLLDTTITPSNCAKCLGYMIDDKRTFSTHIDKICKHIKSFFQRFHQAAPHLPKNSKVSLFKALIIPIVSYACPFILLSSKQQLNKLKITYNRCIKILFRFSHFTSSSQLSSLSSLPSLQSVIHKYSSIYAFKIFTAEVPHIIASKFTRTPRQKMLLKSHRCLSIHNKICEHWNNLPSSTRSSCNKVNFSQL